MAAAMRIFFRFISHLRAQHALGHPLSQDRGDGLEERGFVKFRPKRALFLCLVVLMASSCARADVRAGSLNASPSLQTSASPTPNQQTPQSGLPRGTLVIKTAERDVR